MCLLKMANMLEGGGKTVIFPPKELQAKKGFKLAAYTLPFFAAFFLLQRPCKGPLICGALCCSVWLQMANMLEGGGKTPILPPEELQALGFKLVAYPLSLLGVSIRAMEKALSGLKYGKIPDVRDMGTFVDIQMAVGFPVCWIGGKSFQSLAQVLNLIIIGVRGCTICNDWHNTGPVP